MRKSICFLAIGLGSLFPVLTQADEEATAENLSWDYYVPSYEEIVRAGERVAEYKYISLPVFWPTHIEKPNKVLLFNVSVDVEESFKKQGPCLGISKNIGAATLFLTNDISTTLNVSDDFIENDNPFKEIGVGLQFNF